MRPLYFLILPALFIPVRLASQDPVSMVLRTVDWPEAASSGSGVSGSVFSRQYYGVSNWNATGLSLGYQSHMGQTALLLSRDGIPGFSWYHLCPSHFRHFGKISVMLQLRVSLIDLVDTPVVIRLGGNLSTVLTLGPNFSMQVRIYDFTGWIFPFQPVARGDPSMEILVFRDAGRQIGLTAGFRLNRSQFGPVDTGIRLKINDRVSLTGIFEILPFGMSFGISWKLNGCRINGWLEHRNGMGLTPTIEFLSDREPH